MMVISVSGIKLKQGPSFRVEWIMMVGYELCTGGSTFSVCYRLSLFVTDTDFHFQKADLDRNLVRS